MGHARFAVIESRRLLESGYKVEAILNVAQKTYTTELLPQLTSIPDVKLDKIE